MITGFAVEPEGRALLRLGFGQLFCPLMIRLQRGSQIGSKVTSGATRSISAFALASTTNGGVSNR